jgi:hypothetical protein
MDLPEWEPAEGLDTTIPLSGPTPAFAAFHRRCDQTMSLKELEPSRAANLSVSIGLGLEIRTVFWGRDSRLGHEPELVCLDPDGCSVRTRSGTSQQEPRHAAARKVAGRKAPAATIGGFFLPCRVRHLDRGLLMGAPLLGDTNGASLSLSGSLSLSMARVECPFDTDTDSESDTDGEG